MHGWVSEVASHLVRIHILRPFLGISKVSAKVNTLSTEGDVVASGVAHHVVDGTTYLTATTVPSITPPKERIYEPLRALVCPHIL